MLELTVEQATEIAGWVLGPGTRVVRRDQHGAERYVVETECHFLGHAAVHVSYRGPGKTPALALRDTISPVHSRVKPVTAKWSRRYQAMELQINCGECGMTLKRPAPYPPGVTGEDIDAAVSAVEARLIEPLRRECLTPTKCPHVRSAFRVDRSDLRNTGLLHVRDRK